MLGVLALYGFEGLFVALAFVSVGASRLLPQPAPVSLGARILLLPGAFLLWPWIALRWFRHWQQPQRRSS